MGTTQMLWRVHRSTTHNERGHFWWRPRGLSLQDVSASPQPWVGSGWSCEGITCVLQSSSAIISLYSRKSKTLLCLPLGSITTSLSLLKKFQLQTGHFRTRSPWIKSGNSLPPSLLWLREESPPCEPASRGSHSVHIPFSGIAAPPLPGMRSRHTRLFLYPEVELISQYHHSCLCRWPCLSHLPFHKHISSTWAQAVRSEFGHENKASKLTLCNCTS